MRNESIRFDLSLRARVVTIRNEPKRITPPIPAGFRVVSDKNFVVRIILSLTRNSGSFWNLGGAAGNARPQMIRRFRIILSLIT